VQPVARAATIPATEASQHPVSPSASPTRYRGGLLPPVTLHQALDGDAVLKTTVPPRVPSPGWIESAVRLPDDQEEDVTSEGLRDGEDRVTEDTESEGHDKDKDKDKVNNQEKRHNAVRPAASRAYPVQQSWWDALQLKSPE
jgi:hypothetical protein